MHHICKRGLSLRHQVNKDTEKSGKELKIYISDIFDSQKVRTHHLNLISAGCGTGKSYFVFNNLLKHYPDVSPNEVLVVTSRSLTVQQQSNEEDIIEFTGREVPVIKVWNGINDLVDVRSGIRIMTYDKIIRIIKNYSWADNEVLEKVKIIIFDECHTLYSDRFIRNMSMLNVWIRSTLRYTDKIIFGLTATPEIVRDNEKKTGTPINDLFNETIINYRVKQLICTDTQSIGYLLNRKLTDGKVLVMCNSVKNALELKKRIDNAALLTSKDNELATNEMKKIRSYIAKNETLPPTFIDDDGVEKELRVLIATSTAREGYNLRQSSGVKHIVSYFSDSMNLTQIMGRARYDIDTLVVVRHRLVRTNQAALEVLDKERTLFYNFMLNNTDDSWFKRVQHLVQHDFGKVQVIDKTGDSEQFCDFIEKKWALDEDASWEEVKAHKIWKPEDKAEIISAAVKSNLIGIPPKKVTYNMVLRTLADEYGYRVVRKVFRVQGKQVHCRLIYRG